LYGAFWGKTGFELRDLRFIRDVVPAVKNVQLKIFILTTNRARENKRKGFCETNLGHVV
jgi:hypothetical protein